MTGLELVEALPWPELKPLAADPAPEFPLDSLPPILAAYVRAEAHAKQAPAALPALVAVVSIAAAVQRRFKLQIREGWRVGLNLYAVPVLSSGESKSPVFGDVTRPLRDFERALVENTRHDISDKRSTLAISKARQDALRKSIAREDDPAKRERMTEEVNRIGRTLAETPTPAEPLLIADNATAESVEVMLSEQGGKLAIMAAEGTIFDNVGGRYSRDGNSNCDVLLSGYDGDDLRVSRVGRPPVFVAEPTLSICACLQPSALRTLMANKTFLGRGLLNRIAFAVPESRVGTRQTSPPPDPVPFPVALAYHQLVTALCSMTATDAVLTMTTEAHDLFVEFESHNERQLRDGGALGGPLRGWGSKQPRRAATLAGLFHLVINYVSPAPASVRVEKETLLRAIAVGDFLAEHARRAFQAAGAVPALRLARIALAWALERGEPTFTKRDLHHDRGYALGDEPDDSANGANAWDEPLAILEETGHARLSAPPKSGPKGGRPSSPAYEVNPALLQGGAA